MHARSVDLPRNSVGVVALKQNGVGKFRKVTKQLGSWYRDD